MTYKIKSAIILAAGRGKRLKSLTDDCPKSLLKVRGQMLIERLIEQLQAKGVDNICIVTGYKHSMFDYLNEKYGVTLAYNKKWFCTNNIVSFINVFEKCAQHFASFGTIILDSDLYIEDDYVIRTEIEDSGYYLEYSDDANKCSKEWVVDICDEIIQNVITNGSRNRGFILRSLSFWTPADIMRLYELAKETTKNGKNMQRYIDDVSCVLYREKFKLKGYVAEKNALLEIDTTFDYEQVNKEAKQ